MLVFSGLYFRSSKKERYGGLSDTIRHMFRYNSLQGKRKQQTSLLLKQRTARNAGMELKIMDLSVFNAAETKGRWVKKMRNVYTDPLSVILMYLSIFFPFVWDLSVHFFVAPSDLTWMSPPCFWGFQTKKAAPKTTEKSSQSKSSFWKSRGAFTQNANRIGQKVVATQMDVSKNRGTPKWMVYNGKPY